MSRGCLLKISLLSWASGKQAKVTGCNQMFLSHIYVELLLYLNSAYIPKRNATIPPLKVCFYNVQPLKKLQSHRRSEVNVFWPKVLFQQTSRSFVRSKSSWMLQRIMFCVSQEGQKWEMHRVSAETLIFWAVSGIPCSKPQNFLNLHEHWPGTF